MQKQAKGLPWARSVITGAVGGRPGKEHRSLSKVMRESGLRPGTMTLMLSQPALESEESEAVSWFLLGVPTLGLVFSSQVRDPVSCYGLGMSLSLSLTMI